MKIAIVHMATRLGAKKNNLDRIRRLTKEARSKGARLVVLPSMLNYGAFLSFYSPSQARNVIKNHAERIPMGTTSNILTHIAMNNGIHIITGPIMERAGPRVFLTSLVISNQGLVMAKYRKIVLDPGDDYVGISPGRQFVVADIQERFGILSENDISYPEIARGLLLHNATVLIAFPRIMQGQGIDARVKKLLEARSVENNVPVIAVGGVVKSHDQVQGEVPSLIIDPREGIIEEISTYSPRGDGEENKVVLLELKPTSTNYDSIKDNMERLVNIIYQDMRKKKRKNTSQRRLGKG